MKQAKKQPRLYKPVPCPFCTPTMDKLPLNNGSVTCSMVEMKIIGRGKVLRARRLTPDGLYDGQDMVLINFCPICGRDLETDAPVVRSTTTIE